MSEGSLLDERLEIETPERVVIAHDLAGIGSRFAAGTIDAAILLLPWCAAGCVVVVVADVSGEMKPEEMMALGMALVGAIVAILFLYYIGFELLMRGQTPGKRALKLRVVSVHGGQAGSGAIVLRNVLRLVDMLPAVIVHFLGGVVMFLNRRNQRIGDLAAGTVVVRERPEELRRQRIAAPPPPGADVPVDSATLDAIRSFLARRYEMRPIVRAEVASRLLTRVAETHEIPRGDPETLLGLLGAGRTPKELRDMAGPRPASVPFAPPPPPPPPSVPGPPPGPVP